MSLVKVCQCCLSTDRRLAPMDKHAKLYQALLLVKTNIPVKKHRMVCWECLKILNNIEAFRSKITQAQKLLNDKSLVQYVSLSTLSPVTILDDCKMIIYDDVKDVTLELENDFIKHEKHDEDEEYYALIDQPNVKDSASRDQKEPFKEEMVKDEDDDIFDDTEMNQESQDMEMSDDKNKIKVELYKPPTGANVIETKSEVVKKKITRNRGVLKKKYKTIVLENIADKRSLYDKVTIDQKRMEEWKEHLKNSRKKKKFQCEKCYYGFARQQDYNYHISVRHAKRLGRLECDICGFRFSEKGKLEVHLAGHYTEYVCRLCAHATRTRCDMYMHFTHGAHTRQRECKKCGLRFDCINRREFFDHYRSMHERFACDHCGRVFKSKLRIIAHIKKHHTIHSCKICNTTYATQDSYNRHHQEKHVVDESEQNYCVECNLSFMNNVQYKIHLGRSVKHRAPRAFPCPDCDKVYAKNTNMVNHYKLVHLKKSDYYCVPCDKYYLNGSRFRLHRMYYHEKQPKAKNKLCTYCGKAFSYFLKSERLRYHQKYFHEKQPKPKNKFCQYCGRGFYYFLVGHRLRDHQKYFHEKQPKPKDKFCAYCGRGFNYFLKGDRLRYHQKYFHEKQPKPKNKFCQYCGRGFHNKQILEKHLLTHTGERPFACALCAAAFTQKHCLTAHMRSAHK